MSYRGRVKNGVVVLEGDARLPEGAEVLVEPIVVGSEEENASTAEPIDDPIFHIGDYAVDTGIPDLALNLNHYLYGHPKVNEEP